MSSDLIEIDGPAGLVCALSAVTKKPCRIFNVLPQDLLNIQTLARLCNGRIEGNCFYPGDIYGERFSVNIPAAESIVLALQTLILPALFSPVPIKIIIDGGATDTFFSQTTDYFRFVFLKILEKMGVKIEVNILKRGYYPEGGGKVEVNIFPSKLKNLDLNERGELKRVLIISGASESSKEKKISEKQITGAREILGGLNLPMEEKIEYYPAQCPGSQICLIAEFQNTIIGADGLGKLGKKAEDIGKEAALELLKEQKSNACLDKYMADQILPYLAMASGKSRVTVSEVTDRCQINMRIIEKFIDNKFEIKTAPNGTALTIRGLSLKSV